MLQFLAVRGPDDSTPLCRTRLPVIHREGLTLRFKETTRRTFRLTPTAIHTAVLQNSFHRFIHSRRMYIGREEGGWGGEGEEEGHKFFFNLTYRPYV